MYKPTWAVRLYLIAVSAVGPIAAAQAQQPSFRDSYIKIEYRIPMRDGVKLYTSVYVPKSHPGAHPILLERTPYGAGPYGPDAYRGGVRGSRKFQDTGYIFAYQDVRGRGESEGVFVNDRPQLIVSWKPGSIDESTDTYDTVDFLVKNVPDCNGRVGLWGISYPGFYAGVGAVKSHPALRAASPQAPVSDWFVGDDFHHHGALFLMDAVGFARFGESREAAEGAPQFPNTHNDPYHFYLEHGTLSEITEQYFPRTDGPWRYLMEHGTYDEYWQARSLPHVMRHIHCPVLTVGGWFDAEDMWGALHVGKSVAALRDAPPHTLVMGPWFHGMWAGPRGQTFGDQDFGQPTSTFFQENIEFPFFDACLRGDGRPRMPAYWLFETGANRWRTFKQWPPPETKPGAIVLRPDHALDVSTEPTATTLGAEFDEYVSDPANPVPYQGGEIHSRTREYMIDDQRFAETRKDVLTYRTEPLKSDMTLAGPVKADLFVSTSGSDGDFVVKLIDVFPPDAPGKLASYEMLVRADVFRGKFRNSYSNPAPFVSGQVTEVTFPLPDVLHTFKPGHRLMVQVQSSWFPLVDRNPNTFEDIYHAKPADFHPATIRIYHSSTFSSRLEVGLLSQPASRK